MARYLCRKPGSERPPFAINAVSPTAAALLFVEGSWPDFGPGSRVETYNHQRKKFVTYEVVTRSRVLLVREPKK